MSACMNKNTQLSRILLDEHKIHFLQTLLQVKLIQMFTQPKKKKKEGLNTAKTIFFLNLNKGTQKYCVQY